MPFATLTTKSHTPLLGAVQIILAAVCWGTLGVFTTYLNQLGFTSFQIATLRIMTAAVLILVLLPSLWRYLSNLTLFQGILLALQSLVGVLGMTACYFMAVRYVGAGIAVSLLYTAPVFSLIFARGLLQECISGRAIMLAVLAVVGVGLTMMGNQLVFNAGLIFGLLSGVCYALYGILGKKLMHEHLPPQLVFFSSVTISALVLLCLPDTYHTYQHAWHLMSTPSVNAGNNVWYYILGLSLVGTVIPFFLYMKALNKLSATQASVFTIFEPFTAIVLSVGLLHQPINWVQGAGMGLILLAAVLNSV